MTGTWLETTLPTLLSNFALEDIYNADEFGLFYAALPKNSLHLSSESCKGGKFSKNRLTGLVAASATGDKLPLLIIGKSKNPRCFKGVRNLPCGYKSQKKSWMDGQLFAEWLMALDKKFLKDDRNILMLVDNCPAHPDVPNLHAITLRFLPPNTTSVLQPMDQGVIRSIKAFYRKEIVKRIIASFEQENCMPKISVLDAMKMVTGAWDNVTQGTIINCFKHCHISKSSQDAAVSDSDDPFAALSECMDELRQQKYF